jgi:hypothetical protein
MIRIVCRALLPLALLAIPEITFAEEQSVFISEAQSQTFKEAIRRGELIYLYDQAAWHSTDTMLEDIKDPAKAGVRGWVIVPLELEFKFKAIYYGKDEEGPFEIYSAVWDGAAISDRRVSKKSDKLRLTAEANRLVSASDAARKVEWKTCNKLSPNAVVLPRMNDDQPDSVYILTPQPKADTYSFGGHSRFDVKDGVIVGQRKFANTCLTMSKKDGKAVSEETASFFVTHVLDDTPTEIHVFTMLTALVPIVVMTTQSNLAWSIGRKNGDVVFEVDRLPQSNNAE